ncbi:MAG: dTDP-3-amino-3,6-dideoxy-alpha-D-galactopyranose 3-N-acetyltransferase [Verrucomicrobia subdivision 3 bacterium]|nr:dTDP-3-amino-3,6-dideoxy-alpha-D-galactopyranose 3-N-acetyltransferase [Limisphaerales bacterium]MCS1415848.1 dTDP-3-amino-3,6-dideoxy-alpha-D-galactopyranose 3-N-acetyltransferase [Limisphaerales bacterium]
MIAAKVSIHRKALVDEGVSIKARSRVWAFAHIASGARVGEDCNICDHTFIEGGVSLGNRVTIKCGVYLWNGVIVEDDVFIGPCVAFVNDLRPRSRNYLDSFCVTRLSNGCSIGANSTVLPVTIGKWAMVGAGSVVTKDVPDHALVLGNPARLTAWVCRCGIKLDFGLSSVATCKCKHTYQRGKNSVFQINNK